MKKYLSGLIAGIALTTLIGSLIVDASAISSRMTIEVDPINVQVNGEVFQPTDVTGKEVPVFAYQGTTYAPLRALAEAYGLEVGYDASANMATVTDPDVKAPDTTTPDTTAKTDYSDWSAEDEAAYQSFLALWDNVSYRGIRYVELTGETVEDHDFEYHGDMELRELFDLTDDMANRGLLNRLIEERHQKQSHVYLWFWLGDREEGHRAYCYDIRI